MKYAAGWYVENGYSIYSSLLIVVNRKGDLCGWWTQIDASADFYSQYKAGTLDVWVLGDEPEKCRLALPEPYIITGGFYESP